MFLCYYNNMKEKKVSVFKVILTVLFAAAIFAGYFYVIFGKFTPEMKIQPEHIRYALVGACFVFSLLFTRLSAKKIFITVALAINVAADYFLILAPSDENKLVGLCVFCGVQFMYFLYTLYLNKSIGLKVINMAVRVGLCLLAYFLVPNYFTVGTLEIVAMMYIINFAVSLVFFLFYIKSEWLLFLGFLLFFICDIFVGLTNGGIDILGITGAAADFLRTYDIAFYSYVPGLFFIASSSVWAKETNDKK